jgi:uncharacterized membrane protein YuzA (DUF378 family)
MLRLCSDIVRFNLNRDGKGTPVNRKMTYVFSLIGFFLLWGIIGFSTAPLRTVHNLQATVPPLPGETEAVGIPVTGEPEPVWSEILVFYGLIGLAALFLILALLSSANQSTAPALEHKAPPSEETRKQ